VTQEVPPILWRASNSIDFTTDFQSIQDTDSNTALITVLACLVHQSLASLALTYLTTDIHLVSEYGRRPLRSSTDRTLTVPRTHNRFGDRSFAVAGPRLWNSFADKSAADL